MKNMTYNLTNKNLINLKKINLVNNTKQPTKEMNESKRLLHIYLMKFIKTQFNKNNEILTKRAKCCPKYNNLHLLPYLRKKFYKKDNEKNTYISSYSKITGYTYSKNQNTKTNNNINEYTSKDKNLENKYVIKAFKTRESKINKIKTSRIKSSFDLEPSKIKNIFKVRSDIKYRLNRNVSVKNEETEINKNDSRKETQQRESFLSYKNKTNSFNSKITITKLSNLLNGINRTQLHQKNSELEKNNRRFDNRKNENNDLQKNLTYREEKKNSKLSFTTPEKNYLCNTINKNVEISKKRSIDKNRIINYIKSTYEQRKTFSSENKNNSLNNITNMNIKNFKYTLKQSKNEYINFYKNKFNEYEINDSFWNSKEGNKMNKIEKNSQLKESKKRELINKLSINTKIGYKNQNRMKWIRQCPIAFNKNINNKKNNNNDIIDLI